jgi:aromatic ring-opening dioxygenase catalytic subunit (LigB family)
MSQKMPTYFLSHGGGPWPWLRKEMPFYDELEKSLQEIPAQLPQLPKAILMVSAHWEEAEFSITSSGRPPMLYDYGGFPEHTYRVTYPAPGSPELAAKVKMLLESKGITARLDATRGFDHGAFVPAFPMYPKADVPMIQMSLKTGLQPGAHLNAGRAISCLRDEGVLILGSGLSYHNMRALMSGDVAAKADSKAFDAWLLSTLTTKADGIRSEQLLDWSSAPSARKAHPREEHLIPLLVAVGAAESDLGSRTYHEETFMRHVTVSSFRFGN